jgi:hypothetical protein
VSRCSKIYKVCGAFVGLTGGKPEEWERGIESQATISHLENSAMLGWGARHRKKQLRFVISVRRSSVEQLERTVALPSRSESHSGTKTVGATREIHYMQQEGGRLAVVQLQRLVGCANGSPTAILGATLAIATVECREGLDRHRPPPGPPESLRSAERHEIGPLVTYCLAGPGQSAVIEDG